MNKLDQFEALVKGSTAGPRYESGALIAAARNLAPQFIRLARAAKRVDEIECDDADLPRAYDEMHAALADLLAEVSDA